MIAPESNDLQDPRMAEIVEDKRKDVEHLVRHSQSDAWSLTHEYIMIIHCQRGRGKRCERVQASRWPFCKQVALNSFNVEKQAYYSGTFVGSSNSPGK